MIEIMSHSRHLAPLLLLGFFRAGCGDASSFDIEEEAKPPEAVVRSVAGVWPGARITDSKRIYNLSLDPEFWGDYRLTLELPGKSTPVYSTLEADGTIKRHGGFAEDPLMQTAGQRSLDLRCRAY